MILIPAIDIIDGKCVRLFQGDFDQKTNYHDDPVAVALSFEEQGIKRLHLVDLDGAKSGSIKNLQVLERIASSTGLDIDFGGGVKTEEDVRTILSAGARQVAIGSLAVRNPTLLQIWVNIFGADVFFIGADVLDRKIKINGWLEDGGIGIDDFISNMSEIGISNFFCTDISKDGAMQGPSITLYSELLARFPALNLTASGGVSSMHDLEELERAGCEGAIVGKAIYEGHIHIRDWVSKHQQHAR